MNLYRAAKCIAGYEREVQDRVEIIAQSSSLVLVLADGAGGTGGGAEAAEMVVKRVRQWAQTTSLPDEADWCRCLSEIDSALATHPTAGETTAVVVSLTPTQIMGASVGDSGAWIITPARYQSLTRHQYRKPLLGRGDAFPVPFTTDALNGTLLIASDGLFNYAPAESICQIAQEPDVEAAATHLVECVCLSSGALWDDVAVIVCRPEDNWVSTPL